MNEITVYWRHIPPSDRTYGMFRNDGNQKEMRVLKSDHPKYSNGVAFSGNAIEQAAAEGYTVIILPSS